VKVEAISPTRQDALAGQLSEELYSLLALRAEIDVVAMGELSRPEGKALRVEDKRA
jgi:phenylacetate-coenzyme A ligase PaaK-like adenylate-forming protein